MMAQFRIVGKTGGANKFPFRTKCRGDTGEQLGAAAWTSRRASRYTASRPSPTRSLSESRRSKVGLGIFVDILSAKNFALIEPSVVTVLRVPIDL